MNSREILFVSLVVFALPGLSQTTQREKLANAYDKGHLVGYGVGYQEGYAKGLAAGNTPGGSGTTTHQACDYASVLNANGNRRMLIIGSSSGTDPKTGRQTSYRVPWPAIDDQIINPDLVSNSILDTLTNGETVRVAGFEFEGERPRITLGTLSLDNDAATLTLVLDETESPQNTPSRELSKDILEAKERLRMSHGFVIEDFLDESPTATQIDANSTTPTEPAGLRAVKGSKD